MNPLGNRARAQELARLLEGAVAGPGTAVAGYATLAVRLRALAAAVDPAPAPDFREALRTRLLAVAAVQGVGAEAAPARGLAKAVTWTHSWKAQRRLAVMAGAMAGVVALTGVGIASSRSLPGQPFYGLKRVAEDVQLSLADGDTEKGTKHLEFAATRLREVRALARGEGQLALSGTGTVAGSVALGGSLASRIESTLGDFRSETSQGRSLLEKAYRSTGKKEPLRVLTTFARQQQSRLTAILPELPSDTTDAAEESLALVTQVGTQANELLGFQACDVACNPDSAGPGVAEEPAPAPGATASATPPPDNNGVADCECNATPEPTPAPSESEEPTPSPEPTAEPTPTPTPTPTRTPEPGLLPDPLPSLIPDPIESLLPTALPTLPVPLPTLVLPSVEAELSLPLR
jgi:hypothetical protein